MQANFRKEETKKAVNESRKYLFIKIHLFIHSNVSRLSIAAKLGHCVCRS